jgi:hypothetical protein
LRGHVETEEDRLRKEQAESYRRWREEDRVAREQRLLSGADCGWTQLQKSPHGTTARWADLSWLADKGQEWNLHRVNAASDKEEGHLIGKYRGGGDASKVIKQMAYQPEPRW